jgi:hypothetical protein
MCRSQASLLIEKMKSMQPGSEVPAVRALLKGMRQSASYRSSLGTLTLTFDSLIKSSDKADHEMVYRTIRDTEASDAEKAAQYASLALDLT